MSGSANETNDISVLELEGYFVEKTGTFRTSAAVRTNF